MDVPRPKDVSAFKASRPKDFPSCLKMIKQYGLLLSNAERLGQSDLISAIELSLYHLRYCYYYYSENCDYEGRYFMLLYEDQFPDLTLRPQSSCDSFDIATVVSSMYPGSCDPSTLEAVSESPIFDIVYAPAPTPSTSSANSSKLDVDVKVSSVSESERLIQSRLASFRDAYSVDPVQEPPSDCEVDYDSDSSSQFADDVSTCDSDDSCPDSVDESHSPSDPVEVPVDQTTVNYRNDAVYFGECTEDYEQFQFHDQIALENGCLYNVYCNRSSVVHVRSDNKCLRPITKSSDNNKLIERFKVVSLKGERQFCDLLLCRQFLSQRVIPISNDRFLCIDFALQNHVSLSSRCIPALARDLVQLAGG